MIIGKGMKSKQLAICEVCDKIPERFHCLRINHQWICRTCQQAKTREKRNGFKREINKELKLNNQIRVRTLSQVEEVRKRAVNIPPRYKTEEEKQKIKEKAKRIKTSLSFEESKFLWTKYLKSGLSPEEAKEKVKLLKKSLSELVIKLKAKNMNEEEIGNKFRESFLEMARR